MVRIVIVDLGRHEESRMIVIVDRGRHEELLTVVVVEHGRATTTENLYMHSVATPTQFAISMDFPRKSRPPVSDRNSQVLL